MEFCRKELLVIIIHVLDPFWWIVDRDLPTQGRERDNPRPIRRIYIPQRSQKKRAEPIATTICSWSLVGVG